MGKTFNFKLKELLKKKGYIEADAKVRYRPLAEKIGINHVALWKIVNNEDYNPSLQTLEALCKFFDCEIEDIVERKKG
jgi:putative transcriptional regulator